MIIGLISDTHNLVRPEALAALRGVDHILHAGDICRAEVLEALTAIAPVSAVRGNNDRGDWARALPETLTLELGGVRIYVVHDVGEMQIDPVAGSVDVVVSGHSHKPGVLERDGVRYVNPGSAGPRRFKLPVTLALMHIHANGIEVKLVALL